MDEGGAAAFQFGPAEARSRGVEPHELREALGLVQESMLKLLRFQLALERRDRRAALETMDDVVVLERRLNAIVARLPLAQGAVDSAELDGQRRRLAQEKFALAAGAAVPGRTSATDWAAPEVPATEDAPLQLAEVRLPEAEAEAGAPEPLPDPIVPGRKWPARLAASLALAAAAIAAGLHFWAPGVGSAHSWLGGWFG